LYLLHLALRRKSKDWLAQNQDNVSEWCDWLAQIQSGVTGWLKFRVV
jgi:hypothetical protein